jgi:glycosyltransferase involved in cell wall biosynthesis
MHVPFFPPRSAGRIGRLLERGIIAVYDYRPLSLSQPRVFHELVTRRFAVLEAALCLDELFVSQHRARYAWLPDISVASRELEAASTESSEWEARVASFQTAHKGRPVVVYIGMPQARRGYGTLLRLASDTGACFIHCGMPPESVALSAEDTVFRTELDSRSALLEFARFYQSFRTAQVTLEAAHCVVLPYARHLGSSGVMLQAIMAGRPVLVPDEGLMASRVRNFGLGLTYAPGDGRDMRNKFSLLQNMPLEAFAPGMARFLAFFSEVQFHAAMDWAMGLSQWPSSMPSVEGRV